MRIEIEIDAGIDEALRVLTVLHGRVFADDRTDDHGDLYDPNGNYTGAWRIIKEGERTDRTRTRKAKL